MNTIIIVAGIGIGLVLVIFFMRIRSYGSFNDWKSTRRHARKTYPHKPTRRWFKKRARQSHKEWKQKRKRRKS